MEVNIPALINATWSLRRAIAPTAVIGIVIDREDMYQTIKAEAERHIAPGMLLVRGNCFELNGITFMSGQAL